jgi:hypothetical protein
MEGAPLIFTPELIAAARARAEATRPLIHRWALFEGARRELARAQLERAARLVPPEKRARALGPLHSHEDKQVFAAAGVLLLATVLTDQGWQVAHEPEIEGLTPDLRITKNAARFFVEARHVAGDFGLPAGYQKLQASLRGINTRTPACFSVIEVDGGASLKGFRAFLRRVLDEQRQGPLEYRADGVLIRFELHHPPLESDIAVCFAYSPEEAFWFDDRPAVRAALDEKLKKYSFPLVVALQGIHTGGTSSKRPRRSCSAARSSKFRSVMRRADLPGRRGWHERGIPYSTGRAPTGIACASGSRRCSRSR